MTRAKVPDSERRRIARACDLCKRRKSKCDGGTPCVNCRGKSEPCVYKPGRPAPGPADERPAKRRLTTSDADLSTFPKLGPPRKPLPLTPRSGPVPTGYEPPPPPPPPPAPPQPSRPVGIAVVDRFWQPAQGQAATMAAASAGAAAAASPLIGKSPPPILPALLPQPPAQSSPLPPLPLLPQPPAQPSPLPPLLAQAPAQPSSLPPLLPSLPLPPLPRDGRHVENGGGAGAGVGDAALDHTSSSRPGTTVSQHDSVHSTHSHSSFLEMERHTRILQAGNRFLFLFIGSSAPLSTLDLIRQWIFVVDGPDSHFVKDGERGQMRETKRDAEPVSPQTVSLPLREAALGMVESYLTHTSGFVNFFSKADFLATLHDCYENLATSDSQHFHLCRLYLVLAIGLILGESDGEGPEPPPPPLPLLPLPPLVGGGEGGGPSPGGGGADEKPSTPFARAEAYFQKALRIRSERVDNFDESSAQIFGLCSVYMLCVSARNEAWIYKGIAIQCAIAVGCHRPSNMIGLYARNCASKRAFAERCELWRSLYVLDRFLSVLMGRPCCIADEHCTDDAWSSPDTLDFSSQPSNEAMFGAGIGAGTGTGIGVGIGAGYGGLGGGLGAGAGGCGSGATAAAASLPRNSNITVITPTRLVHPNLPTAVTVLDDAVQVARFTTAVLKNLYCEKKFYRRTARAVAQECCSPRLEVNSPDISDRARAVAMLHANLFHQFSLITLTCPFFLHLYVFNCKSIPQTTQLERMLDTQSASGVAPASAQYRRPAPTRHKAEESLSEACVKAAHQTVDLAYKALDTNDLSRRNPFVITFVFTAALVLMGNQFAAVHADSRYDEAVSSILAVVGHCSVSDPQARRLVDIITNLKDVIDGRRGKLSRLRYPGWSLPMRPGWDPIDCILRHGEDTSQTAPAGAAAAPAPAMPRTPVNSSGGGHGWSPGARVAERGPAAASSWHMTSPGAGAGSPGSDTTTCPSSGEDFGFSFDSLRPTMGFCYSNSCFPATCGGA